MGSSSSSSYSSSGSSSALFTSAIHNSTNNIPINKSYYDKHVDRQRTYYNHIFPTAHQFILYTAIIDNSNHYFIADFVLNTFERKGIKRLYEIPHDWCIFWVKIEDKKLLGFTLGDVADRVSKFSRKYNLLLSNCRDFVEYTKF